MVNVYKDYNEKGCGCTVYILNPWLEVMYYWQSHTSSNSTDQYIGPGHLKGIILFVLIATRTFFAANTVINNIMAGQYQLIYKYWGDSFIPRLTYLENKISVLTSHVICIAWPQVSTEIIHCSKYRIVWPVHAF